MHHQTEDLLYFHKSHWAATAYYVDYYEYQLVILSFQHSSLKQSFYESTQTEFKKWLKLLETEFKKYEYQGQ